MDFTHEYQLSPTSNIRAMQLFYELKKIYPAVPDTVVNNCLKEGDYDKETALRLLIKEAPKYGHSTLPLRKLSPSTTGSNKSSPSGSSPSYSPVDGARGLPPPLPGTPPVANVQAAPGQATPPIYASPLYRPDTDLTLPPPDAGTNPVRRTGMPISPPDYCQFVSRTSSLNVVLQSDASVLANPSSPCVAYTSSSQPGQLRITITNPPNGRPLLLTNGSVSPIPPDLKLIHSSTPQWQRPISPLPAVVEQRVTSQCERLESLRKWLEDSRREQIQLRQKVDRLQEELTKEKRLLVTSHVDHQLQSNQRVQSPLGVQPSPLPGSAMVDLVRLRQEVESLQLECQRMYQELDEQAVTADHHIPPTSSSFPQSNVRVRVNEEEEDDLAGWDCGTCTFKNHVALLRCEECDMPRPVLSLAARNTIRPDPMSVMVTTEGSGNQRANTSPTEQRQPPSAISRYNPLGNDGICTSSDMGLSSTRRIGGGSNIRICVRHHRTLQTWAL